MKQQITGAYTASPFATDYVNGIGTGLTCLASNFGDLTGAEVLMPVGGTIRNFRARGLVAQTGANTQVFTYVKNGSASTVAVTLNAASGTAFVADTTHELSFVPGDTIALARTGPSGQQFEYTLEFEGTDANTAIYTYGGSGNDLMGNGPEYNSVFGGGSAWTNVTLQDIVAVPGTIIGISHNFNTIPGGGTSRIATIMLGGVAQDGTGGTTDSRVTVANANTTTSGGYGTYATIAVPIVALNRLAVRYSVSGSPAIASGGGVVAIQSSVANTWNIGGDSNGSSMVSGAAVFNRGAGLSVPSSSAVSSPAPLGDMSVTGISWAVTNAPGLAATGKSWTLEVYKGGAAVGSGALIFETLSVGSATFTSVAIADGDTIGIHAIASVTAPTNTGPYWWTLRAVDLGSPVTAFGCGSDLTMRVLRGAAFSLDGGDNVFTDEDTLGVFGKIKASDTITGSNLSGTNTGDVTLAGTPNYLTIAGQVITRALVNLASHVTSRLPFANFTAATAASVLLGRRSGSSGDFEEVTVGSGLSMSAGAVLTATGGTGDVVGPASAVDDRIATFDGTTGKLIQDGGMTITGVIAAASGGAAVNPALSSGRLTLETGVPISTTDQTGKTTVYFTPYMGNFIALYTSSTWTLYTLTEISVALGTLTSGANYDVFAYDVAGVVTLKLGPAWSSNTSRGTGAGTTELDTQDGVYVNKVSITSGPAAKAGRYLGTFRTTSTTATEDSGAKRFLWNAYNQQRKFMIAAKETADTWNYTTATFRQANANAANQLEYVSGLPAQIVDASVLGCLVNLQSAAVTVGIGVDSTSVNSAQILGGASLTSATNPAFTFATYSGYPGIGSHTLVWLEWSAATGTTTWVGDAGRPTQFQAGITGSLFG